MVWKYKNLIFVKKKYEVLYYIFSESDVMSALDFKLKTLEWFYLDIR